VRSLFLVAAALFLPLAVAAQEEFAHPELEWKTIETDHFFVHYHDGAERTARTVAKIAEDVYEPVTSLYNHKPTQKVSFIIKDYDDIANGAAYFFDNKIEIYAPSMDFELRGTHNWLRNVVTHEFTHIVQIQTSMKFGRRMPALYLQWMGYESERRPDVLYGYPNVVVSYPLSGFVVPAWFAEGVAQYNRKDLRYDFWDSHRDMILRSYALDGTMLTWEEMGVFGKTSLGNESSYNAGFAFVVYIAEKYGEDKLAAISRNLATLSEVTIDGAIERAVGKSGGAVYEEWRDRLRADYAARVVPIRADLREGVPLVVDSSDDVVDPHEIQGNVTMMRPGTCFAVQAATGFANMYPAYSSDGAKVAYVSTKGADYFILSSLYVYDFVTRKEALVQPGVRTGAAWSPDGTTLYYGKNTRDNPHWSLQFDLYAYSLVTREETRITRGRRAVSPAVSPDGKRLAFVVDADGTSNLATVATDGSDFRRVTSFAAGEQVYAPHWSPAGDRIIFDYSIKDGRDIASVAPDGTELRFLVSGPDDSRSSVFTPDGSRVLFASDRTGIFNLYTYELATGSIRQVSNVLGGAFFPTVNAAGDIIYSAYTSSGYKLYHMTSPAPLADGEHRYLPAQTAQAAPSTTPQFDWAALRRYDDTLVPSLVSRPYKSIFTSVTFVPFIRVDNYNAHSKGIDVIKPGLYIFSNDVLEHTGFFAGIGLNRKLERDLFLQFNYRGRIPLLYQLGLEPAASAELYNVTRKTSNAISLPASTIPVDLTYDLLEFDFALNQPFLSQFSKVEFRFAHSRYTSNIENFINPETQSLQSGSSDLYLIANTMTLTFLLDAITPSRTSEVNPTGRKVTLHLARELNKFNGDGEYEVTSTGLQPRYKRVNFTRAELEWKEYVPFFFRNHTLALSLRGGAILGPPVDGFFNFYASGLVGMKGYPFYALGGNHMASVGLAYRFPILNSIDVRILQLTLDKLYASVYVDAGNAWREKRPSTPLSPEVENAWPADKPMLRDFKTDAGIELRLESFSFYSYPTRVFLNASYGFDRFATPVPSRDDTVTYGREWRFYFGILFGFDFD
jgi:Tol biopolymer transport system component